MFYGPRRRWAIFNAVIYLLFLLQPSASTQTDSEKDWAYKHYQSVIDALLPIKGHEESVGYRFLPADLTLTPEFSFILRIEDPFGPQQDHIVAEIRRGSSVSILKQLIALHHNSPAHSLSEIQKKIKVDTMQLSDASCPAVRTQFEKLEKINFKSPPYRTVILDAPMHEFWIDNEMGTMSIKLSAGKDANLPLVTWASETLREIDACTSGLKPK